MRALGKGSFASFLKTVLGIVWVLLWVVAAAVLVFALSYAAAQLFLPHPAPSSDITSGEVTQLFDEPWQIALPGLLIGGVVVGGALIIVWRLRRLFDSFSSGEPFRKENAEHLRVVWITMLVVELSRQALLALTTALLVASGVSTATMAIRIDLSTWVSIFVLIAIAEAFREGARMREEQELTI